MTQIAAKDPEKLDWFEMYPEPFFGGTEDYDFETKSAYALVLFMIYGSRRGRLQDDPQKIARKMGFSTRKWNQVRAQLLADEKLQIDPDGFLVNRKATAYFDAKLPIVQTNRRKLLENTREKRPEKRPEKRGDKIKETTDQGLPLDENPKKRHIHARESESESESELDKDKTALGIVIGQVDQIAQALDQKRQRYWEDQYRIMLENEELTFEDVLAAAQQHKANGSEHLRRLSGLVSLAKSKRDARVRGSGKRYAATVTPANDAPVEAKDWKEAMVKLAYRGVWPDARLGALPGTEGYAGPKDLEAAFLVGWHKQGAHPLEELDASNYFVPYPAERPVPDRRTRWSAIR